MQGIHGMSGSVSPDALGSDDEGYDGGPSPVSAGGLGAFPNLYDDEGQPITGSSMTTAEHLFGLSAGEPPEAVYAEKHDADNFTLRCVCCGVLLLSSHLSSRLSITHTAFNST